MVLGNKAPNTGISPSLIKHCGFTSWGSITLESAKYLSNTFPSDISHPDPFVFIDLPQHLCCSAGWACSLLPLLVARTPCPAPCLSLNFVSKSSWLHRLIHVTWVRWGTRMKVNTCPYWAALRPVSIKENLFPFADVRRRRAQFLHPGEQETQGNALLWTALTICSVKCFSSWVHGWM